MGKMTIETGEKIRDLYNEIRNLPEDPSFYSIKNEGPERDIDLKRNWDLYCKVGILPYYYKGGYFFDKADRKKMWEEEINKRFNKSGLMGIVGEGLLWYYGNSIFRSFLIIKGEGENFTINLDMNSFLKHRICAKLKISSWD